MAAEVFEDASGEWRWRLVADNGEIVAQGESHRDRTDAERALRTALDVAQREHDRNADPDPPLAS